MKSRLFYGVYLLVVVAGCLALLEVTLHFFLQKPRMCPAFLLDKLKHYYDEHDRNIIQFQHSRYDEELFYTLIPGHFEFNDREFETTYSVNSIGCRDTEEDLSMPKIISIGDSYCMGWGVEQDEVYSSILENEIGQKVLNMGVSSYGTPRELEFLKRVELDSLKWLVIQHHYNDELELLKYKANNGLVVSSQDRYDSICAYFSSRSYYPLKYLMNLSGRGSGSTDLLVDERDLELRDQFTAFQVYAEMMNSILSELPRLNIISFTLGEHGFSNDHMEQVAEWMNKNGKNSERFSMIDFSDKLAPDHFFVLDDHLNSTGHTLVARELARHIDIGSDQ